MSVEPASPPAEMGEPHVLFLCTGNAARSVMAGAMLSALAPGVRITTAGTHVIEGHPMSWRTRDAIVAAGFVPPPHRSRQLSEALLFDVDVVAALAGEHVLYVRRHHPGAASRTVTLKRLCRDIPPGEDRPVADRLARLDLARVGIQAWEDVEDPAGGELPDFIACAEEIRSLCQTLAAALGS